LSAAAVHASLHVCACTVRWEGMEILKRERSSVWVLF